MPHCCRIDTHNVNGINLRMILNSMGAICSNGNIAQDRSTILTHLILLHYYVSIAYQSRQSYRLHIPPQDQPLARASYPLISPPDENELATSENRLFLGFPPQKFLIFFANSLKTNKTFRFQSLKINANL